jgi:flagellar biosynthesis protein FlhF
MIIRRYIVNDMREAIIRAKYELGSDAIIISQKSVRPGKWYNLFRKTMLEVTVAIEENIREKTKGEKAKAEMAPGKTVERIEAKAADKRLESTKKDKVFGRNEKAEARWRDYCQRHAISEESVGFEQMKRFLGEEYPENPFCRELKLGKINVLVGPTGVGKTTSIAKIASGEFLQNNRKVGLITIDTYRIAAVEQLKKYAEILGINCEPVSDPSEMKAKLSKLKNCDILLIDTVGASPKNEDRIEDVKLYLEEIEEEKNTYLTMSMSSDVDTNNSILEAYRALDYDSIILTKFDEVKNFNNFWNMMENNGKPIQYYSFGQTVPEDIRESSLDSVLSYLWGEL